MSSNKLKHYEKKTEVLAIYSKASNKHFVNLRLKIGNHQIEPSKVDQNLGAMFKNHLSMDSQISHTTKSVYFHQRRIAKIKHNLSPSACTRAIHATVTSRLDFNNGLLDSISTSRLRKLQVAQNSAARLLTSTPKQHHITPILKELHWLPIKERCQFKVLCAIHQSLNNPSAPSYLHSLFAVCASTLRLRSSSDRWLLSTPRVKTTYGSQFCEQYLTIFTN
jgi:hypothetical protein